MFKHFRIYTVGEVYFDLYIDEAGHRYITGGTLKTGKALIVEGDIKVGEKLHLQIRRLMFGIPGRWDLLTSNVVGYVQTIK